MSKRWPLKFCTAIACSYLQDIRLFVAIHQLLVGEGKVALKVGATCCLSLFPFFFRVEEGGCGCDP